MITNRHAKKCFRLAMIEQDEEQCNEYLNVVETYFTQQEKLTKNVKRYFELVGFSSENIDYTDDANYEEIKFLEEFLK